MNMLARELPASCLGEDPAYLSGQLLTYIGNKRLLLPLIQRGLVESLDALGKDRVSFADVFAGSGVVSRMARRWCHTLYVNDFEGYSAFVNRVYHANKSEVDLGRVDEYRQVVNQRASSYPKEGFIARMYAPANDQAIAKGDRAFYSRRNALFIDTARQEISRVPGPVQPFLLAPLIQRASVHANTSGVFKGFYKNHQGIGQFGGAGKDALKRILEPIEIPLPTLSNFECTTHVTQKEAADFVTSLPEVDLAYFDPPYNQHPYGSNYFMLNLILNYMEPASVSPVSGIPKDWQRSDYNVRKRAAAALTEALSNCPAKVLMVSYNAEGFIGIQEMTKLLNKLGRLTVFSREHNTFRGCRNLCNRPTHVKEFLFRVERSL